METDEDLQYIAASLQEATQEPQDNFIREGGRWHKVQRGCGQKNILLTCKIIGGH